MLTKTMYPHFTFLAGSEQNESDLHFESVIRYSAQMLHFCISDATGIYLHYRLKLQKTKKEALLPFAMRPANSVQTREVKRHDKYHSEIRFLTDSTTYFSHQQNNRSSIWHKIKHLTSLLVPESKVVITQCLEEFPL